MKEFLQHFKNYMVQTFDDREYCEKDKGLTILLDGDRVSDSDLKSLNDMGAGIFFTPNQFKGQRLKAKCLGINAWFMECDWCPKEQQMEMIKCAGLEPSFIVETKKSLHTYWLAKDANVENFEIIQKRLIYNFQADEACKDCTRVLRIPGFKHRKTKEPFDVKLIHSKPENVYTEQQMLMAFKPEKKEKTKNIWEKMGELDNKTVLERLSGKPIVNGEVYSFRKRPSGGEFLDVNGKPADAWLDIEGMIGSGKKGGPTWIQWLKYYGCNAKAIFKWAMENLKDLLPEISSDLTVTDLDLDSVFGKKKVFSWGVKKLDDEATIIQQEQYIALAGETGVGKTTFALQMAIENAKKYKVCYLSLEMSNEALLVRYALLNLGISVHDWKSGKVDKEAVQMEIGTISPNLKLIKTDSEITIDFLQKTIENGGYDMVFIDNLGFVDGQGKDLNEKSQNVSRQIKWLANETKACIVALHHFRKASGEKRQLIRPIDALIGTSKISHDVNMVIQVAREQGGNLTEEQKEDFWVIVQKDRDFGMTDAYKIKYKKGRYY